jgi:NAD(P)-dependent dehydrogenase (short-subunit alcohol dehydrogenase family)
VQSYFVARQHTSNLPGLGLVQGLVTHDNVVVFAGARNPDNATHLHDLAKTHPGKVYTVKLVLGDVTGNQKTIEEVKKKAGRLDVLIANAGTSK